MFDDCSRKEDRRQSYFDFRKNKVNNRKKLRRKIDKINYSIYYVIITLLAVIIVFWGIMTQLNILGGI